jgi:hypothetical protein
MGTRTDLRIGDADREAAAASLREHYAQGRLSLEEFNERLDAVFAATTRGRLDAIMGDLPHVRTPYVPLPVTTAARSGAGSSGAGSGGVRSGRACSGGGGGAGAGRARSPVSLVLTMAALLIIWFLAVAPMMTTHFHFFSWPGRFSLLLAGLMVFRSLVRRLFGSRHR